MISLLYPALSFIAIDLQGLWSWIGLAFNLVMVPSIDYALRAKYGRDVAIPERWRPWVTSDAWMIIATALQIVVLNIGLRRISEGVDSFTLFGMVSTLGIAGGCLCITAAHELVHRRLPLCRAYGLGLLTTVFYMHFRIDHVYGHHRNVGTAADLASAAKGEPFFTFFNRALLKGWGNAWRIEAKRLSRRGKRTWSVWNRLPWYAAAQISLLTAVWVGYGSLSAIALVLQAFIAVHLLEATNYVQHYGVARGAEGTRGGAEQCWDSDFLLSNMLLFNVPMHGLHHESASTEFVRLSVSPKAHMLPASFHLMVFAALFPPIWRRIMDHRTPDFVLAQLPTT